MNLLRTHSALLRKHHTSSMEQALSKESSDMIRELPLKNSVYKWNNFYRYFMNCCCLTKSSLFR